MSPGSSKLITGSSSCGGFCDADAVGALPADGCGFWLKLVPCLSAEAFAKEDPLSLVPCWPIGRGPNCIRSHKTSVVRRCCPCLSSHARVCKRPSISNVAPFTRNCAAISAVRPHITTFVNSVVSCRAPVLSVHVRFVATPIVVTDWPLGVVRSSGFAVTLPTKMTLLKSMDEEGFRV